MTDDCIARMRALLADSADMPGFAAERILAELPALLDELEGARAELDELARRGCRAMSGAPDDGGDCTCSMRAYEAQRHLRRIIKTAREDKAVTPRSTRLARALAEAQRLLDEEDAR
jgi:hypothetical protein